MILGIVGGVGSGKSTVTDILQKKYGFNIYHTDDIAKELMGPGMALNERLRELFGDSVFAVDGYIDKNALSKLIYSDDEKRRLVNNVVHPSVWAETAKRVARSLDRGEMLTAVETALPDEFFRSFCTNIWFVYAETGERVQRLIKSRGYTEEKCKDIIASQKDDEAYREISDAVIDNTMSIEDTEKMIGELLNEICQPFERQ